MSPTRPAPQFIPQFVPRPVPRPAIQRNPTPEVLA
jgi:hypothetical protein